MKRFWAILLCLTMLLPLGVAASATELEEEPIYLVEDNAEVQPYSLGNSQTSIVELSQECTEPAGDDFVLVNASVSQENIDFSSAIPIDSDAIEISENNIMPADVAENQAPVGQPAVFIINPESMRDDQFTTETIFYIATRWNNQDLCYDPEGGPISLVTNSFPAGYIEKLDDIQYGTFAGYAIHIFNRGSYLLKFAFDDLYGGRSVITSLNLDIISRGVFETIDGSFASSSVTNIHKITVDYSIADTYCLSFLRTGTGGFTVTVYSQGVQGVTECGSTSINNINNSRRTKTSIELKCPEGVTGSCTYTVYVRTSEQYFIENDTTYRLVYGAEDQQMYFFEDISDCVDLPYFVPARTISGMDYMFENVPNPSDYGDYYKITATGPETVTLSRGDGHFRFKILSTSTLETLYDSYNQTPYDPYGSPILPTYYISVTLNFTAGESYYVVVYNPNLASTAYSYCISVGDRDRISKEAEYTIPALSFVKGTPRTLTFELTPATGLSGYVDFVDYGPSTQEAFWMHGSLFSVLSPGTSTWRTNVMRYDTIDFGYTSGAPLVSCGGTWTLKLTPVETGTYPGGKITVYYWCEV